MSNRYQKKTKKRLAQRYYTTELRSAQTSSFSLTVDSITIEKASYSQTIRQKSTTVLSNGAWVAMNASRC